MPSKAQFMPFHAVWFSIIYSIVDGSTPAAPNCCMFLAVKAKYICTYFGAAVALTLPGVRLFNCFVSVSSHSRKERVINL